MSAFLNGTDTEGHFPLDLVIRKSVMFCTETANKAKTKIRNTSYSEQMDETLSSYWNLNPNVEKML